MLKALRFDGAKAKCVGYEASSVAGSQTWSSAMLADKDFQRMFTVERQRTERSQRPFILLLLDMGDDPPSKVNREILGKVLSVLSASTRDSDVIGWWNNSVLGVMFTEFGCADFNTLQSTLTTRLSDTLRTNLNEQQFNEMCISFHLFPEEWNHDIRQTPTDPDAPVYSPLKPKPHLRSGGAMAIPVPDGAVDFVKAPCAGRRLL